MPGCGRLLWAGSAARLRRNAAAGPLFIARTARPAGLLPVRLPDLLDFLRPVCEAGRISEARTCWRGDIAEYYLFVLPEFLALALPIALLLALLYALTNHARHQEITAIRAAGVSLWRLSLPYLGVGLLASLALFAANEFWAPDHRGPGRGDSAAAPSAPNPSAPGPNEYRNLCFENTRDGRRWRIGVYNTETGEMIHLGVYPIERGGSKLWELRRTGRGAPTESGPFTTCASSRRRRRPIRCRCQCCGPMCWPCRSSPRRSKRSTAKSISGTACRRARPKKADVPIKDILNYLRLHPVPPAADRAGSRRNWRGGWRRR